MWEIAKLIAAVVVVVLLLDVLDITEILKGRLRGGLSRTEMERRLNGLETRVADLETKTRA